MEVTIQLDSPGKQLELFGPADSHLRLLRTALGVQITARQGYLIIKGPQENVNKAAEVIEKMQKHLSRRAGTLTAADVTAFIAQAPRRFASQKRSSPAVRTGFTPTKMSLSHLQRDSRSMSKQCWPTTLHFV